MFSGRRSFAHPLPAKPVRKGGHVMRLNSQTERSNQDEVSLTNKYGPTRSDLKFRLAFSVIGLSLTLGALAYRGLPKGPGGWEAIGISSLFFGGTFVWTVIKIIRKDHPGAH
jgi:hypothetical protein